jgi:hypothetical protein
VRVPVVVADQYLCSWGVYAHDMGMGPADLLSIDAIGVDADNPPYWVQHSGLLVA